jgi:hypothetical protein
MEIFSVIIACLVAYWIFKDGENRYPTKSIAPLAWAVGTFLLMIVFLPLYLISRPKKHKGKNNEELSQNQNQLKDLSFCIKCKNKLKENDVFCSNCGAKRN